MSATEPVIEEMVKRIIEAIQPDRIILFGSHARGEAGPDSDVDLLVVAPSDEAPHRRVVRLYRATRGLGVAKDILWYTPEEFSARSKGLMTVVATAIREGKVVYERAA